MKVKELSYCWACNGKVVQSLKGEDPWCKECGKVQSRIWPKWYAGAYQKQVKTEPLSKELVEI